MHKAKYLDFEQVINDIIETCRMMRSHYICWSIEDDKIGITGDPVLIAGSDKAKPTTAVVYPPAEKYKLATRISAHGSKDVRSQIPMSGVHIHVYMECSRTIRWSTVVNKWQKNGFKGTHVEVRTGWRETCREYHMGIKNYEEKPSHIISGEWGKWREDLGDSYSKEDYFELAAQMIIAGYNPSQVARRFPAWYIRHGYGVLPIMGNAE